MGDRAGEGGLGVRSKVSGWMCDFVSISRDGIMGGDVMVMVLVSEMRARIFFFKASGKL